MKKTVQIILKKDLHKLGHINQDKKVAKGYAFNYLIPKGLAEIATKGKIKHINMLNQIKVNKTSQKYQANLTVQRLLTQIKKINIRKKIGQNNQIFGSINENDISTHIFKLTGQQINKRQISLTLSDIKSIGIIKVFIKIDTINTSINLNILPIII